MLIPWRLLQWARDNRVLRIRWFGLEAEFAVQPHPRVLSALAEASVEARGEETWQPPPGLPPEEGERRRRERERAEAEKVLYHWA